LSQQTYTKTRTPSLAGALQYPYAAIVSIFVAYDYGRPEIFAIAHVLLSLCSVAGVVRLHYHESSSVGILALIQAEIELRHV
jgi:hypothetical protein